MLAADHGLGSDATKPLDGTAYRRVLRKRQVRSRLVLVTGVHGDDPAKVSLAEHDHVVDAVAAC
jgi:hypothetical protein